MSDKIELEPGKVYITKSSERVLIVSKYQFYKDVYFWGVFLSIQPDYEIYKKDGISFQGENIEHIDDFDIMSIDEDQRHYRTDGA